MSAWTSERRLVLLAGVIFVVVLGITGRMDADDEALELDHYCRMVKAGAWPDYRGIYHEECDDDDSTNDQEPSRSAPQGADSTEPAI